jgi:hypothetical protein
MWGSLRVSPGRGSAGNEVQSPDKEGPNRRTDKDAEEQQEQQLGIVSSDDDDMFGSLEDDQMVDLLSDHPQEPSMLDEDEMEDYVPASLASFVQEVQSTMERGRQGFLDDVNEVIMTSFESAESSQHVLTEDDSDRKLKGDVLGSIERRRIERQERHDEVLVPTEDQKADINPDFWSPELKKLTHPNPVATMTDSDVKREATVEFVSPAKAAPVLPPHASPPPSTSLPDQSAIMNLVSSLSMEEPEMEIDFDQEPEIEMEFEQEEEMESDIDSDASAEGPVNSQASSVTEKTTPARRSTLTASPAPSPQSPTLAEMLGDLTPERSVNPQPPTPTLVRMLDNQPTLQQTPARLALALNLAEMLDNQPTPERSVKPQPPTPTLAETLDNQPTPECSVEPHPPTLFNLLDQPTPERSMKPQPPTPTLAETLLDHPTLAEMLLDQSTPERSVNPQTPTLFNMLDQTPERSVKPQPSTPGSQVSYIGDIDETTMTSSGMPAPSSLSMSSPTAKALQRTKELSPPNPPSPVSSMSSSPEPPADKITAQPRLRLTVVTTATVQPKSPTGRGQSIRRTLEMNKKLAVKKNIPVLSVSTRTAANRQATTRHVSQGMTASRALSTSATKPRLTSQGTAAGRTSRTPTASQPKMKTLVTTAERRTKASQIRAAAAAKTVAVASSISAEDARARARQRVRDRLLKEKVKSPVVVPKKCSVDDKVARAQERARQRQSEKEATLRTTIRERTKPAIATRTAAATSTRTAAKKVPSISTTARPSVRAQLTVPRTPKFATTVKLGAPKVAPAFPVSMANSTEVLKKGLRGDLSLSTPQRKFSFPRAPHFATTDRHGEKPMTPGGGSGTATLAQSGGAFLNGLRKSMRTLSPSKKHQHNGLTIPKGPKFQPASKRALPQSMAEKETEEMEYYKSHPFKAAPIMVKEPPPPKPASKPVKRRLTTPKPFSLRSDTRAVEKVSTDDRECEDIKEMKQFKFQARPMPSFTQATKLQETRAKASAKTLTQPKPFQLTSSSRATRTATHAEEEAKPKFHARPVPKSTYQLKPLAHIKSPSVSPEPHAPRLSTSTRTEKRKAAEEASSRRVEALALEREKKIKDRQRGILQEALKKADLLTPRSKKATLVEPFQLKSDVRHEKYQKELEEKLQQEEAERLDQMDFHARPLKPSPPPPEKVHSSKSPTQPEPFHMPGMDLVELHQQETERKRVEMEEEEKRLHSFKARPMPKTNYFSPPAKSPAKSETGSTGK